MPHFVAPSAGFAPLVSTHLFDVTIIGGGPVGLFAAFYAGLRQMTCKIIDSLEELGGQLTALYPEKYVYDVAGFPKVFARDLARNLIEQAMEYHPTVCLGEVVTTLEVLKGSAPNEPAEVQGALAQGLTVYKVTSDRAAHYTRTLIISAGAGAFSPKRLMLRDAATVAALENRGIYYACKSKSVFADKRILIAGGGDSALDWAWNLCGTAAGGDGSGITLIHRRNQFRAHDQAVKRLQGTKVRILTFTEIDAIHQENGVLKAVELINNQTKQRTTLPVDAILVQFGFSSSLGPIKNWPLRIEKSAIAVNQEMETDLPGVFAVGDVSTFKGKLKLMVTGFGEAAIAVNVAKTRIDPHAKMFPGHSSEMSGADTLVTI